MSYSLSIITNNGLVLAAASNNGYANKHRFIWPGERFIVILSSGHIATIEAVIRQVNHDINQNNALHIRNIATMNEVTDYIAGISAAKQKGLAKKDNNISKYEANFILAGQIGNQPMETLLIYAQGNFIHEPKNSPFLQIGEIKYGKPILDRMVARDMPIARAARCALVSLDSTLQSDTDTHYPIEVLQYQNTSLSMGTYLTFEQNNPLLNNIAQSWNDGITDALDRLPTFYWES